MGPPVMPGGSLKVQINLQPESAARLTGVASVVGQSNDLDGERGLAGPSAQQWPSVIRKSPRRRPVMAPDRCVTSRRR